MDKVDETEKYMEIQKYCFSILRRQVQLWAGSSESYTKFVVDNMDCGYEMDLLFSLIALPRQWGLTLQWGWWMLGKLHFWEKLMLLDWTLMKL
jgi:hypothetical protein